MKKIINNIKENYKLVLGVLVIGIFLGWIFFHQSGENAIPQTQTENDGHDHAKEAGTIWTCSMHPQIKKDKPGKCPICSMDLIPVQDHSGTNDEELDADAITLSDAAARLAQIETMKVVRGKPTKEVYLQGKVHADERNIAELTARFGGRIEKLFVNFTGQNVRKGEKLATIYSPGLVTAQRELLEAISFKETRPALYRASRAKLKLWDLTDGQIDEIEQSGEPIVYFDVLSPISGTVMKRHVALGDYVKEGSALFQVIDLKKVWVMFDAYESDLPWIKLNDKVNFSVQALPGKSFSAKVTYIDPFLNARTRVAKVRVEMQNKNMELKPEMFANGIVDSDLADNSSEILIPKSSILWTGKRAIVYVKSPNSKATSFKYRKIVLGPEAGNFYVVAKGLMEGETIATNGVFKIDAASQLQGLPSMMNPEGGAGSTPHDMSKMDMGGGKKSKTAKKSKSMSKMEKPAKTAVEFKAQLKAVYDAYIKMKDAFVASDGKTAAAMAAKVKKAIGNTDMALLKGDAHIMWMGQMTKLNSLLEEIINEGNIEKQRFIFSKFNPVFAESIKNFGLNNTTAYYQFCPMANDSGGAYWISESKEIKNPYFGDKMLGCGETKETFNK